MNKVNKNSKKLLNILLSLVIIYTTFAIFGIKFGEQFTDYFKVNGEYIISLSIIFFTIIIYFSINENLISFPYEKKHTLDFS